VHIFMRCMLPNGLADGSRGSGYPMGRQISALDPATQWAGGILLSHGPADRCCESCYLMDRRKGDVAPATQSSGRICAMDPGIPWAGGWVLWILLPNRLADRCMTWIHLPKGPVNKCRRFCFPMHRKKRFTSFPSPAGMSLTKLPLGRNNSVMTSFFIPAQGEFGSDIPAGDGKLANLFFTVWADGKVLPWILTLCGYGPNDLI
jgi:hypothetical protein